MDSFQGMSRRLLNPCLLLEPSFSSPVKCFPEFILGAFQNPLLLCRKSGAGAVDVKIEHRHGRLIGRSFAPVAAFSRAFQRKRNPAGASLLEHIWFEIQRIATAG